MFTKKQLTPNKRICLRLAEARENQGMTVEEMAKKLRLSSEHITTIEECRFEDLPFATIYQKNIIKKYLQTLGIEPKAYLDQFVYEELSSLPEKTTPEFSKSSFRSLNMPFLFRMTGVAAIFILLGSYFSLQVKRIVDPPTLVVYSPTADTPQYDKNITVKGKTDKEAQVFINGKEVMNNEQGEFQETVSLEEGVNEIQISAKKKHGKLTNETRYVMVRDDNRLSMERRTFVP